MADRFWAKVDKSGECWIWTAYRDSFGYGRMSGAHKGTPNILAYRFSWEQHFGPIPEGEQVLHRCDNPPCVRPEHLFLGNKSTNMLDMWAKHRARPRGLIPKTWGRADNP
jgi:hypothetical protein